MSKKFLGLTEVIRGRDIVRVHIKRGCDSDRDRCTEVNRLDYRPRTVFVIELVSEPVIPNRERRTRNVRGLEVRFFESDRTIYSPLSVHWTVG